MIDGTCPTPGCGRESLADRRVCGTCHNRRYRAAHPVRASFLIFRASVKRRRRTFDLSFHFWKLLCRQTGYHLRRGNGADGLTVDRIDADLPYVETNVQVLTRSENARKWWEVDKPAREARAGRLLASMGRHLDDRARCHLIRRARPNECAGPRPLCRRVCSRNILHELETRVPYVQL